MASKRGVGRPSEFPKGDQTTYLGMVADADILKPLIRAIAWQRWDEAQKLIEEYKQQKEQNQ